jgi:hypothetical protein
MQELWYNFGSKPQRKCLYRSENAVSISLCAKMFMWFTASIASPYLKGHTCRSKVMI